MSMSTDQQLFDLYMELAETQHPRGRRNEAADAYALCVYYARRLGNPELAEHCRRLVRECHPHHVIAQEYSAPLFFAQLLMRYPAEDAQETLFMIRKAESAPAPAPEPVVETKVAAVAEPAIAYANVSMCYVEAQAITAGVEVYDAVGSAELWSAATTTDDAAEFAATTDDAADFAAASDFGSETTESSPDEETPEFTTEEAPSFFDESALFDDTELSFAPLRPTTTTPFAPADSGKPLFNLSTEKTEEAASVRIAPKAGRVDDHHVDPFSISPADPIIPSSRPSRIVEDFHRPSAEEEFVSEAPTAFDQWLNLGSKASVLVGLLSVAFFGYHLAPELAQMNSEPVVRWMDETWTEIAGIGAKPEGAVEAQPEGPSPYALTIELDSGESMTQPTTITTAKPVEIGTKPAAKSIR